MAILVVCLCLPVIALGSVFAGMLLVELKMGEIEDAGPISLDEIRKRAWAYSEHRELESDWSDRRKYQFGVPLDVPVSIYRFGILGNSFVVFFDENNILLRVIPLENPA